MSYNKRTMRSKKNSSMVVTHKENMKICVSKRSTKIKGKHENEGGHKRKVKKIKVKQKDT